MRERRGISISIKRTNLLDSSTEVLPQKLTQKTYQKTFGLKAEEQESIAGRTAQQLHCIALKLIRHFLASTLF